VLNNLSESPIANERNCCAADYFKRAFWLMSRRRKRCIFSINNRKTEPEVLKFRRLTLQIV
jgi:hypothetical protein